jgi:type IV secretory pathway TraG/TraD family ATPase VirD4
MDTTTPSGVRDDNDAQRFATDTMERLISEVRQLGISMALAHQSKSQLSARKADALSGVRSIIMFRVNSNDAQYLRKDL